MFETIIREAASRFGLGDKAGPLVQMLLAYITDQKSGGLAGFMAKLHSAGLGNIASSWLGGGAGAQAVNGAQLESMLGGSDGLLGSISSKLGIGGSTATAAIGYILPAIIGKLTPGGALPTALPADVLGAIGGGKDWLAGGAAAAAGAATAGVAGMGSAAGQLAGAGHAAGQAAGGGLMKWLPWVAVAIAGLFAVNYFGKGGGDAAKTAATATTDAAKSVTDAAKAAADAAKASADAAAKATADAAKSAADAAAKSTADAAKAAADAAAAQTAAGGAGAAGARVVASMVDGMPALKVYFDSGKVAVASEFGDKSKTLMDFLKSNASAKAVISGFNDPTGNPAANAELAKNRAKNVAAALKATGLPEDRVVLEKAADTTAGAAVSLAEARRVEVSIRK